VLPAGQAAYAAIIALVDRKSDSITFSPQHSFSERRFELTVAAQNAAFATDEEESAVYSSSSPGIEFDQANSHIDVCPTGSFTQTICGRAGNLHSVGQVSGKSLIPERGSDRIRMEERIAWQPGLAKSC